jgi:K+-transporting ATPase ATPase A chain
VTPNGLLQIGVFFLAVLALTKPLGGFMARVFEGERTWLHAALRPLERLIYRLCGIQEAQEQRWTGYAASLLMFSVVSLLLTYLIQRIQGLLPFNPQGFGTTHAAQGATAMTPDLAFNTAVSFTTNTNWQAYTPETTMSYVTQMVGLATHNFFSAAAGMAIAIALIRGFARHTSEKIGNFWVDMTRATVYILLPLSIVIALLFVSQGVIQNLSPYSKAVTLEGGAQLIAQGPVASQEAIKMLGTNGGGFFNANSAHPFENPTPLSNFIQILSIFVIPAGFTYTFGKMVKDTRQGWAIFAAMSILFLAGVFVAYPAEQSGNPNLTALRIEHQTAGKQPGG